MSGMLNVDDDDDDDDDDADDDDDGDDGDAGADDDDDDGDDGDDDADVMSRTFRDVLVQGTVMYLTRCKWNGLQWNVEQCHYTYAHALNCDCMHAYNVVQRDYNICIPYRGLFSLSKNPPTKNPNGFSPWSNFGRRSYLARSYFIWSFFLPTWISTIIAGHTHNI